MLTLRFVESDPSGPRGNIANSMIQAGTCLYARGHWPCFWGQRVRIAVLDDIHQAYEGTSGVRRLRDRAEVKIFTAPFGDPATLRGFDAVVANRERTRFTRELFDRLPDLTYGTAARSTCGLSMYM